MKLKHYIRNRFVERYSFWWNPNSVALNWEFVLHCKTILFEITAPGIGLKCWLLVFNCFFAPSFASMIFVWRSTINWIMIMCLLRIFHYLCCRFEKIKNSWIFPTFDRRHDRRWQWKWTVIVRWFVYAGNNIALYSRFTDQFVVVVDIELILSMEFIFWFAYFQSLQLTTQ